MRYAPKSRLWVVLAGCAFATAASAATIDLSTLTRVGTTQLVSTTVLRLTPNFDTNAPPLGDPPIGDPPAGAAWTPGTFNVADPFAVNFAFRMSDAVGQPDPADGSGGDGIAFLIQGDPRGTSAIGRGAGGMGFLGIYNSLAVMLDTYQNNYSYGDPSGNYVAVNTRGTDFNVPHHFCTGGELTTDLSKPLDLPGVNCSTNPGLGMTVLASPILDDGNIHNVTLVYTPGLLTVRLDAVQVLSVAVNLAQTLSLQNGTNAYIGFTAGTRFAYQNQDIVDFGYTAIPEPATIVSVLGGLALMAVRHRKRKGA